MVSGKQTPVVRYRNCGGTVKTDPIRFSAVDACRTERLVRSDRSLLLSLLLGALFFLCSSAAQDAIDPKKTIRRISPPRAAQAWLELLDGESYRLLVRYDREDPPGKVVTYGYIHPEIELNDHGVDGDLLKGDQVYSAIIQVTQQEIAEAEKDQRQLNIAPAARIPVLRGRTLAATESAVNLAAGNMVENAIQSPANRVIPLSSRGIKNQLSDDEFASRALMITQVDVVEDRERVFDPALEGSNPDGVWSFKYLFDQLIAAGLDSEGGIVRADSISAATLVEKWLETFAVSTTVNGQPVEARPDVRGFIDRWKAGDSSLNLAKAPFRLMAIFVRPDLAGTPFVKGDCGEARLVFGALDPTTLEPLQMTLILEYAVASTQPDGLWQWCSQWCALAQYAAGSKEHRRELQKLTETFVRPSLDGAGNEIKVRSWLSQIRTNELAFGPRWEMREWVLAGVDGTLIIKQADVKQTPANRYNRTPELAQYIEANKTALSANPPFHEVPLDFPAGNPFRAGVSRVRVNGNESSFSFWTADGLTPDLGQARIALSLNTCNGCHATPETRTHFTHVGDLGRRPLHRAALLSDFLLSSVEQEGHGLFVPDPAQLVSDEQKARFVERTNRRASLENLAKGRLYQIFHSPIAGVH